MPKVLLKDQKMLNLRRMKIDEIGPSDLYTSLTHFGQQRQAKRLFFMEKTCFKAWVGIEKTHVVCCGHPKNIYFMLSGPSHRKSRQDVSNKQCSYKR